MTILALLSILVIFGFVVKYYTAPKMIKTFKRDRLGRFSNTQYKLVTVNDLREEVGLGRYQ